MEKMVTWCEKFEHWNALPDEPEDCWFCTNWMFWEGEYCMIPEQERRRLRYEATTHKDQRKLLGRYVQ